MQWFDQEINLAEKDGVSHPENLPFFLTPLEPNGQAVVLVHGFGSSPREMLSLGKMLHQHHFTVFGVRLPGHGTTPEDLASRSAEEWVTAVEHGYLSLASMGFRISSAGLSTGALLTLKLALQHQLESLILLAPFLKLQHLLAPMTGLLSYFVPYQKKEIAPSQQPFYYQRRPLKGIAQIHILLKHLAGQLETITAPSLVLTSTGDAVIAKDSARHIHQQLGGNHKQFYCYGDDVPHVLTTTENPRQQDVLQRCINFLEPAHHSF